MRIFERFGFNLCAGGRTRIPAKVVREFVEWEFSLAEYDWINDKGNKLCNFRPLKELVNLLENKIDIILK